MINEYVTNLATQMGITISYMSLRKDLASTYVLSLESNGSVANEFVYQSELDGLQKGSCDESLELKVRVALVRLKRNLVH